MSTRRSLARDPRMGQRHSRPLRDPRDRFVGGRQRVLGANLLEAPCNWQRGRRGQRGASGVWDPEGEGIPRPARASRTAHPAPRAPPASGSDATAPGVAPTGKGRFGLGRERGKEDGPAIPPLLLVPTGGGAGQARCGSPPGLGIVSRASPLKEHTGSSVAISGKFIPYPVVICADAKSSCQAPFE